jgi:TPR repeat protein
LKGTVKAESEAALPSAWSRFAGSLADPRERPSQPVPEPVAALAERFSAASDLLPVRAVQTTPEPAVQPQPAEGAPRLRALDRDEIATLYRRSEELIGQGDIAGARLLLTRAAEAGDARSALALGATYDAASLTRLGVRGIAPDAAQAAAWYAKAAEFGSAEASRRLEQIAQSAR